MEEPLLSFEDFKSVDSLDGLVRLYATKGVELPSAEETLTLAKDSLVKARKGQTLARIGKDWGKIVGSIEEEAKYEGLELRFPCDTVFIGDVQYSIHGVVHAPAKLEETRWEFGWNRARGGELWLHEQNLGEFVDISGKVEVFDHVLHLGLGRYFMRGLKQNFRNFLSDHSILGFQKEEEEIARVAQNTPREACFFDYPHYVRLEIMGRRGKYEVMTARSAYQAEFMRACTGSKSKHIVVGKGHSLEIKYFLEKGVGDDSIVRLAQSHASLLNESREKYLVQMHKKVIGKTAANGLACIAPYLAAGAGVVGITRAVNYGVGQFFK